MNARDPKPISIGREFPAIANSLEGSKMALVKRTKRIYHGGGC